MTNNCKKIANIPLVDQNIVSHISAFRNSVSATFLIQEFDENTRMDLEELYAVIQIEDWQRTAAVAHRARGLCLLLGAMRLAHLLERIEKNSLDHKSTSQLLRAALELDFVLDNTLQEMGLLVKID